jgi:hypothetical protein
MYDMNADKNRVIRNIMDSRTKDQFDAAVRYAHLAKMQNDPKVKGYSELRKTIGFISSIY